MAMELSSPAFRHGATLPERCVRGGADRSPPLRWSDPPEGTRSLALLMEDPDAADGLFTHWLVFDLPPDLRQLPEGGRDVGVAGRNDFHGNGWGGPAPPPNEGEHRYVFRLLALDVERLDLGAGATREQVLDAARGHVLDEAVLAGRFGRHVG